MSKLASCPPHSLSMRPLIPQLSSLDFHIGWRLGSKGKKVEASALMWAQQSQNITAAPGAGRPAHTGAEVRPHPHDGQGGRTRGWRVWRLALVGSLHSTWSCHALRHWGWWEVERWQVLSQGFRSEGARVCPVSLKGGNLGPGGSRGELVQSRQTNHLAQSFAFLSCGFPRR